MRGGGEQAPADLGGNKVSLRRLGCPAADDAMAQDAHTAIDAVAAIPAARSAFVVSVLGAGESSIQTRASIRRTPSTNRTADGCGTSRPAGIGAHWSAGVSTSVSTRATEAGRSSSATPNAVP
jgi:hypothetical protein